LKESLGDLKTVANEKQSARKTRLATTLLTLPGLAWLTVFMVVPCGLILAYSFMERGTYGGIVYNPNTENFLRAFEGTYLKIFLASLRIAIFSTIFSLLIAYPAAMAISRLPARRQLLVLFLVILPFWSNYLIRSYAWIVLLNNQGIVNKALMSLGITSEPLPMLYNQPAIVLGLVYNYLPFVILSIYASIQRLNPELLEASDDLGASAWRTFYRIMVPLTAPGIAAGGVFVFVLSIGNFVTPDLLGGGKAAMVGNVIYSQFMSARDWPFGAALALLLLTIMFALLCLQAFLSRNANLQSGRTA
jgi:spermidine/putrescine transport system permease protein